VDGIPKKLNVKRNTIFCKVNQEREIMKIRVAVLGCLIAVVFLSVGHRINLAMAAPKTDKGGFKIGVVSVQKIIMNCQRSSKYRQESLAERNTKEAELNKLLKEVEAEEAGLKTLKPESLDRLARTKDVFEKRASLQARKKFYEQVMVLREQRMIESLYTDILRVVGEIAEQNGLSFVFERSEPELPTANLNDLSILIKTSKVLYSGGGEDISDEVIARLDAGK